MCCVIAMLAGVMSGSTALAQDSFRLTGIVRDFREAQSGFNMGAGSFATVMGLVNASLGMDGRPVFSGSGRVMSASALDAAGRPVMAIAMPQQADVVTNFLVEGGSVVPQETFAVELKLIGAAIENGTYDLPVTAQVQIGNLLFEPFGPYLNPVAGNVNDVQTVTGHANPGTNPRTFRTSERFAAGSAVRITGRSWTRIKGSTGQSPSHWEPNYTVTSGSASTRMLVVRDGDEMPNYDPAYDQDAIEVYLAGYVDAEGRIDLSAHQVIYLFELGTSTGGDFQDLVVLATFVPDPSDFADPPPPAAPACVQVGGSPATLGAASSAGIASADGFQAWFADAPSVNMSQSHTIEFRSIGNGIYEHSSADFAPIDGKLFGNESAEHNRNFTFSFSASFTAVECGGQFFEFAGTGDAWAFIDGQLAMDLGGMNANSRQMIDLNRLGLDPNVPHDLRFFYASRANVTSPIRLRTNMVLSGQRGASLPGAAMMVD
jgi:fibro-slime domain-containing protein